jgi:hypothetical protein
VLIEFVLITALFMVLIAGVAQKIPVTLSDAAPYLGGKLEVRLETGGGFKSAGKWIAPIKDVGGARP